MGKQRIKVTHRQTPNGGIIREVKRSTYIPPPPKKKDEGGCWVATAYYGDKYHPDVNQLRYFRESLIIQTSISGVAMRSLNTVYLFIGRTDFGQWWASGLQNNNSSGKNRKLISSVALKFLLKISTKK